MATSRRRERELARRRFERRRQAELERRAKQRRRNTILGAVGGTVAVIVVLVLIIVKVVGGGSSSTSTAKAVTPAATPTASTSSSASPAPPAPTKCATITPDPPAKGEPVVPQVTGKAPTKLVTKDVKVGTGATAKSGDKLTVKYVGISCSTGKPFDASYTDGAKKQQFAFTLGKGMVIPGWDQGLVGMKVGGRRELVIPASLGYGATGSGSTIKGNETLIFVIDLVKV